jgi:hypothetical protein
MQCRRVANHHLLRVHVTADIGLAKALYLHLFIG